MFSASMVAIVTPMSETGGIDFAAWDRLLDFHLEAGTAAVVVAGTTGESPALSIDEIVALTRRAVMRCGGRMQVIVGAGTNSTSDTIARVKTFSTLGADALMLVTPYYNKPPQEGLYQHFMAAANAASVPVILYNVPSRTAVDLQAATVARLAQHARIVAIKDATASMERLRELIALCPPQFVVLSGDDASGIEWLCAGAKGVISVTANVAPRSLQAACTAALAGDFVRARAIDATLQALHRDLFIEASPIPVKWAVARLGLIGNAIRLPLVQLSPANRDTIRRAMQIAGVIQEGQAA